MSDIFTIISGVFMVIGALLCLIAALGVLRLPDLYTRMHAASKAGTLGAGLLFLAIALASGEIGVVTRSIAGVIFFIITAPVSAHLLARSAYFSGLAPWSGTKIDDLAGKYNWSASSPTQMSLEGEPRDFGK
ncbi:MAG: monovalent cation/H(+) antiporter subunit G [Alphaproteobacteria bacterium]